MIQKPFALGNKELVRQLDSDIVYGLNANEVQKRQAYYGKNEIPDEAQKNKLQILGDQFLNPIIYILTAASLLAFLFRDWLEGFAIVIVIAITVMIGFFMELQAIHSLITLRKMGVVLAGVLRSGKIVRISSSSLVPGDIIILEPGNVIGADARIVYSENLAVKESALTGESIPIEKNTEPLAPNMPVSERKNMVYKGTTVVKGFGKAIITAIGANTELGKIQKMSFEVVKERTPLEKKLNQLSKWLIWLTLLLAILIIVTGYIGGKDILLMIQTSIALAVAAIPEGLPIVATIALAQGMIRLSKKKIIVKKLEAVETLGATNVICTDKTGTLTEDKMHVHTVILGRSPSNPITFTDEQSKVLSNHRDGLNKLIITGLLCNNVLLNTENRQGDSADLALIEFAESMGFDPEVIRNKNPEKLEIPFDPETKMMATLNQGDKNEFTIYVKGAFESIVDKCSKIIGVNGIEDFVDKSRWAKIVNDLASQGLRTLAFAYKQIEGPLIKNMVPKQLTFIGVTGFIDPARKDVKSTIQTYKNAGIKVVMITGDHAGTATKIAKEIGLVDAFVKSENVIHGKDLPDNIAKSEGKLKTKILNASIFARVTPKQKLDIVTFHQQNNNIVGMIGDGINDIPSLRKADIGIATGIRGTDAAREAADIILTNDQFTSTELAIRQGRVIFTNIRQFVIYLLSCNLAEIIAVGIAALVNLPSPLIPLQILFLNLITDIFPALALGLGKGQEDIMRLPPRKADEPIITRKSWYSILVYGFSITLAVIGIVIYAKYILKLPSAIVNNMAFYTLIFAQLLNVFNMPQKQQSFLKNEVTTNKWVWAALLVSILLVVMAYLVPPVANALSLVPITLKQLGLAALFGFFSLCLIQLIKRLGMVH